MDGRDQPFRAAMTEFDTTVTSHAEHYAARLESLSQWFEGDMEQAGRRQLIGQRIFNLEQGNILAVLDAAEGHSGVAWLGILAHHLWLPLEVECEFRLMRDCGERLLALAVDVKDAEYSNACHILLAHASRTQGKPEEALSYVQTVLATSAVNSRFNADAWCIRGAVLQRSGKNAEAADALQNARTHYERLGRATNAADAMVRHAMACHGLGEHQGIIDEVKVALEIFREHGNLRRHAAGLVNLAYLLIRMGRAAEAEAALEPALELKRMLGDKVGMASSLLNLGCCQMMRRAFPEARATCTEALRQLNYLGLAYEVAAAHMNLGMICYAEEDWKQATEHLQFALRSYQRTGNRGGECSAHRYLGMVSLAQGSLDLAIGRLNQSSRIARELHDIREQALCAALTGALLVRRGEYAAGEQLLTGALAAEAEMQLAFENDIRQIIAHARATLEEERAFEGQGSSLRAEAFEELHPLGTWQETLEAALARAVGAHGNARG